MGKTQQVSGMQPAANGKSLRSSASMTTADDHRPRALSAIRLSVTTDETTSPDRQREANEKAAAELGAVIVGEAEDLDVSASKTSPFERPELGEWLKRPEDFDVLLFWRFDRPFRSMDDAHELCKWARDNRKMIVIAEGPGGRLVLDLRNPLDPIAQLMVTIFAFAAQMEAHAIRERVTGAQAAMRAMPLRWRGARPPYGYMPAPLETGGWTLAPDPDAVAVIERAIRELVSGRTATAVAAELNADDIPSPRDHWALRKGRSTGGKTGGAKGNATATRDRFQWTPGVLGRLLASVHLIGWKTHNGKPVRDSEGAPVMSTATPVLTREEFDAIGALFADRSVDNRERKDTRALLLRVIHCDACGGRMYLSRPTRRGGSVREHYKCNAPARGDSCPAPANIRADWADDYAAREFLRSLGGVRITESRTVPGYDPQPEIDATLAEFEEHQREAGRQKSKSGAAAWQRRADALDARLADLESRERVEPRTERIHSDRSYATDWVDADTAGRRELLLETGARLTVRRGQRGGWRSLDESRVSLSYTVEFFADAADEIRAVHDEFEGEAA